MKASFYSEQIATVLDMVEHNKGDEADQTGTMSVADVIDPRRLQSEKEMFRRQPLLIAHSSELAAAGDYKVRELDGRSWLLVRGKDGIARAFLNYCQHRGTRLEQEKSGCKHRFSCPYHAWTYDTSGALVGVPRSDLFPGLDKSKKGLKQARLEEEFGFLWLTQEPGGTGANIATELTVKQYMEGLADELSALGFADYSVYFDQTREIKANWKLPLFAFLESYHIGTLHKDSIADFFIQNVAHSEQHGPHIRSFVPRKRVVELADADLDQFNISDFITPTNIIFPNICMIAHPTSYSVLTLFPGDTPGSASWRHMLLVPELPTTDAGRAHYDKTVEVLDGMTYEGEDFWVSEQIQQGMDAGAIDELLLGKNESLIKVFNDTVGAYLPSRT